jgi:hypothetical protein
MSVGMLKNVPNQLDNKGADLTIDSHGTVAIRLVGGSANDFVFVVPQTNLLKFFGVGYPVSRYEPEAGNDDVLLFRYVSVN